MNETSFTVKQEKYIKDLLKKYGLSGCKASRTPMTMYVKLTEDKCPLEVGEKQRVMSERTYRCLIDSLNYLSLSSSPDIAQASHITFCKIEINRLG